MNYSTEREAVIIGKKRKTRKRLDDLRMRSRSFTNSTMVKSGREPVTSMLKKYNQKKEDSEMLLSKQKHEITSKRLSLHPNLLMNSVQSETVIRYPCQTVKAFEKELFFVNSQHESKSKKANCITFEIKSESETLGSHTFGPTSRTTEQMSEPFVPSTVNHVALKNYKLLYSDLMTSISSFMQNEAVNFIDMDLHKNTKKYLKRLYIESYSKKAESNTDTIHAATSYGFNMKSPVTSSNAVIVENPSSTPPPPAVDSPHWQTPEHPFYPRRLNY